jgi:enamidase
MRKPIILMAALAGTVLVAGLAAALAFTRGQYRGLPLDGPPIALVGARIYDPAGDSLIEGATVIVQGREIVAVDVSVTVPDGARVLNLTGLTLLPGFIDSHVHLSGIRARASDGSRELGWLGYFWKFARKFPDRRRALIENGVTTVKSLGDPYPWITSFAEKIERHQLAGPRVFAAGPMFTAPGGHPVAQLRAAGQGDTSFIAQVTRQIVGPAEARTAVNRISRHVDYISAVLENRGFADLPVLAPAALHAITTTAHGHDLRVLAHVNSGAELAIALAAGVDGIEHVPFDAPLDSAALDALSARRVFVDPTLQAIEGYLEEVLGDTAAARMARANTRTLYQAGVPLLVGSDAPGPATGFGTTVHEELRNLVELGLTPGAAIAAATYRAAECLGLADRLGSVEPGKWADLVAVEGDPLVDITATSAIYLVIADGQLLLDRLARFKRPGSVTVQSGPQRPEPPERPGRPGLLARARPEPAP